MITEGGVSDPIELSIDAFTEENFPSEYDLFAKDESNLSAGYFYKSKEFDKANLKHLAGKTGSTSINL